MMEMDSQPKVIIVSGLGQKQYVQDIDTLFIVPNFCWSKRKSFCIVFINGNLMIEVAIYVLHIRSG
jgi:hypothetical protein